MLQKLIVAILIVLSAVYVARYLRDQVKSGKNGKGCSKCGGS